MQWQPGVGRSQRCEAIVVSQLFCPPTRTMPESTPYRIDPPSVAQAPCSGRRAGGLGSVSEPQLTGTPALASGPVRLTTPESIKSASPARASGRRVGQARRLTRSAVSSSASGRQRPRRSGVVANHSAISSNSGPAVSAHVARLGETPFSASEGWLRNHAGDLIAKLRDWSMELDQRELELLVRHEDLTHRERRLRIRQAERTSVPTILHAASPNVC